MFKPYRTREDITCIIVANHARCIASKNMHNGYLSLCRIHNYLLFQVANMAKASLFGSKFAALQNAKEV